MLFFESVTFVFPFAIVANVIGCTVMTLLAVNHPVARAKWLWMGMGLVFGGGLLGMFRLLDGGAAIVVPFLATSALCALICRLIVRFD